MNESAEVLFEEGFDLAESRKKITGRGRIQGGKSTGRTGRYVRARKPRDENRPGDIAIDASLRAAALRKSLYSESKKNNSKKIIRKEDLREKVRVTRGNRLVLFLVDASDSMDTAAQLAAAKGAVLSLLSAAYVRRDRVGLIAFRDEKAAVLLPPTSSVYLAREKLKILSAGGATPFADGLLRAWKTIRSEKLKHRSRQTVLVVLSDGEANVSLVPGADSGAEIKALAELIRGEKIRVIFVDTRPPGTKDAEPKAISEMLGAEYRRITRMGADELIDIVL